MDLQKVAQKVQSVSTVPADFNLWRWLSANIERSMPLKDLYYLRFPRWGPATLRGPRGEAFAVSKNRPALEMATEAINVRASQI